MQVRQLVIALLAVLICFIQEAVSTTPAPTRPPTIDIPATCNLKNGMKVADCTALRIRWTQTDCRSNNVDHVSNPVVWLGAGCVDWPTADGGCKIYNMCDKVHCQRNCAKMVFCAWSGGLCQSKASLATATPTPPPTDPVTESPSELPTESPTEYETKTPSLSPSELLITLQPTSLPTSSSPTVATSSPTLNPVTRSPTVPGATSSPTATTTSPTTTLRPTTSSPTTNSPTTTSPTAATASPTTTTTASPSITGATQQPTTRQPTSQSPTSFTPTASPVRRSPTVSPSPPTTPFPTVATSVPSVSPTANETDSEPGNQDLEPVSSGCDQTCAALATTFTVAISLGLVYLFLAFGFVLFGKLASKALGKATVSGGGVGGGKSDSNAAEGGAGMKPPPVLPEEDVESNPFVVASETSSHLPPPPPIAAADQTATTTTKPSSSSSSFDSRERMQELQRRAEVLEGQLDRLARENTTLEETNKKMEEEVSYLSGISMEL